MKYDITFHPSWWHENAGIDFTQQFFDDPEYRMEADIKMRRTLYEHFGDLGIGEKDPQKRPLLGTDLLAAGYLLSELMGCGIRYQADNSPQVECMDLDEDSIDQIQVPDLDTSEVWQRTQKQIDYLLEKYGHVETYVNLQGIQNIAMDIMGQELMVSYYTAPEEINGLLEKITKMSIEVGKRFKALSNDVSGGVTAIVRQTVPECYLTSNCSVEMISNDLYEEFLLKYDQELADAFGNFGIHHCGKSMEHVVEGYSKVKGLTFAEVGAFSDIKTVRSHLPGIFLNARYSPVRLMNASKEDIFSEVKYLAENGQENGQKISVSCVGIDNHVSDTQIRYFLEACRSVEL
ncbi:MAG TPA: hypothetical protein H9747_13635 [Candidatus Blautia stercorigallinarum]|uniref:Uroporphyrinogen decarboxylase (URO-D) domain-containing protein n=1 Tax=Candidatus Blautia stercorigallinarum TaxID=2838501 RepID=A0A9D1PGU5_9FIRM|nr:hypothetical protein [Candidatus Blautia stercorigallinarum]